jgi:CRISPR-associated protein Csm3
MDALRLLGKVIIEGDIKALTGIRIGGAAVGVQIGGIDNPVIRDPVTQRPYIPGSSIKGKMRSLLTKALGRKLRVLVKDQNIRIHWCEPEEFEEGGGPCKVCRTFGMAGEHAQEPTRLIVCDAPLLPDTLEVEEEDGSLVRKRWADVPAELGYTEVKMEAVIDVVTSAATPRHMERVPPGALFRARMLLSVYDGHDRECLRTLFLGMRLLEDDYLGSSGSRGYGRIRFQGLRLVWRPVEHYYDPEGHPELNLGQGLTTADLTRRFDEITQQIWGKAG